MNRWFLTLLASLSLVACHGSAPGALPEAGNAPQGLQRILGPHLTRPDTSRAMRPSGDVGSGNTVTADMPVPRPDTKACRVTLFNDYKFKNYNYQTFAFAPPAACPGPWAKVVFNFDVGSTKGIQYDRTGIIWLDGAPIFFGTTAEPTPSLSPRWHVERDVTDLSALFKQSSQGQIALGNCYCKPYLGILFGTAYVQFYPPNKKYPAPAVADMVVGMPYAPPLGNSTQMPKTPMTIATKLPQNIVSAYLDVYLQSQNEEEQWFMCVPDKIWFGSSKDLGFCRKTAFREGEISVDGKAAGTAPIYPWIYTGGLDPDLWAPIPGVQTLAFTPFRVDLTPFAGPLSDGTTHSISVDVADAYNYFTGTGDLLLFLDPNAKRVTGKLVSDSLVATPPVRVHPSVVYGSGAGLFGGKTASGPVEVSSRRDFSVVGYVVTSAGKITTTVRQTSDFDSDQTFAYTATAYSQVVDQLTTLHRDTTTAFAGSQTIRREDLRYPIEVAYPLAQTSTGFSLPLKVYQGYVDKVVVTGGNAFSSLLTNTVESQDTMIFDTNFNWINAVNGASLQLYTYKDSTNLCYGRQLESTQNVVSSDTSPGCSAVPPPPPRAKH